MYQKIESEYNLYMSSKVKNIEIAEFKKKLAKMIGTTISDIYEIIKKVKRNKFLNNLLLKI